jgi:hypothetical protein
MSPELSLVDPLPAPRIDIPRHVWDAVNNAIHTSAIKGSERPISLCHVAVRAAIKAYVLGESK